MSELPEGWKKQYIQDVAMVSSGGTPSRVKSEYWQNGKIPWIRTTEVQNCILFPNDVKEYITEQGLNNSSAKKVPVGTILLAMIGQGKTRGQVALLNFEATTNQNCATIIFNDNQEPLFFFNYLLSQYEKIRGASNSAGQSNLSGALIKQFKILVPPLPEQRKIAEILSTWDKAIATTEKQIANSKEQKKALMQQLLTGKKRMPGFSGDWQEVKLGDLGNTYNGLTGKSKDDFGQGEKYIPYVNIFANSAINTNALEKVRIKSTEKQNSVQYGDFFFTTSSETPEEVGMSSVMLTKTSEKIYLNSFCFGFRPNSLENISPEFMQYLLRSSDIRRSISVLAQGATRYNLSKKQLMKINLPLPPLPEQQKIAQVLTTADKEIAILESKLSHLQDEKKALMQQLLTGKIRVRVG